jgi:5-methylcytosine-specific restriction endonuclease McrA
VEAAQREERLIREWKEQQRAKEEQLAKEQEEARKLAEFEERLSKAEISDNRHDYVISNKDYKRGLPKERDYTTKHKASLFRLYDNRCANCGDDENGLEIDHFVFSKNEGGCFAMKHKDGHLVNNAVPLCKSCNASKSDEPYKDFFTPEKLLEIFEKNVEMTKRLNKPA